MDFINYEIVGYAVGAIFVAFAAYKIMQARKGGGTSTGGGSRGKRPVGKR